jgi:hypothetical protein
MAKKVVSGITSVGDSKPFQAAGHVATAVGIGQTVSSLLHKQPTESMAKPAPQPRPINTFTTPPPPRNATGMTTEQEPGAAAAFKGGGRMAKLLPSAQTIERGLGAAGQLAVIGGAAYPVYADWKARREAKKAEDEAQAAQGLSPAAAQQATANYGRMRENRGVDYSKFAALLPLQKPSLPARVGNAVGDFAGGAVDELDHQAEKLLTPSDQTDPIKHRTPRLGHII